MPLAQGNVSQQVPFPVDNFATSAATTLNVSGPTVIKASPGRLVKVTVLVAASSGSGSVNDSSTLGSASAANQVAAIPSTMPAGTILAVNWPMMAGITVAPGAGQTLAIAFY